MLQRPPRDPRQPILGRPQWVRIVLQSLVMTGGIFGALGAARLLGFDARATVSVTFLTLAFAQLWQVFNMRADRSSLLRNEITRNPWVWAALCLCSALLAAPPYIAPLAQVLGLVPLEPRMWAVVLGLSAAPVVVWQAGALILGRLRRDR